MLAHDFAVGRDQFAGRVGQRLALLREVSVQKFLVVATGDKANFLGVRLLSQGQARAARPTGGPQASSFPPRGNRVRLSWVWVNPNRK